MIIIAGHATINPNVEAQALDAIRAMVAASETEVGCISYQIYIHPENSTQFFIFEEWESQAALDAHFQTEHMKVFSQQLPQLLASPIQVKRYEVSQVTDL